MITASLPGSGEWGEHSVRRWRLSKMPLPRNGVVIAAARKVEASRAERCCFYPQQLLNWWDDVTVELRFYVCRQSFATSVVRELINTMGDCAHIADNDDVPYAPGIQIAGAKAR